MSTLVEKLSKGKHPVSLFRYKNHDELKAAVDREFVLVKFTETRGGTEVGFRLDRSKSQINFERPDDAIKLVGEFGLDYLPVECSVSVDSQTFVGEGFLRVLN